MGGIDSLTLTGWTAVSNEAAEEIRRGDIGVITKRDLDGGVLTITTTKGTFVFSAPELEDPGLVSPSDIVSALGSLDRLQDENVLFDIYMVMQLAHEVAKHERTTAREMRNLERDLQMSEIGKQVDKLRSAATLSMVMGLVTAGVTIGMAGFSALKLASTMKPQMSGNRVQQYTTAKSLLGTAETKVTTLGSKLEQAQAQLKTAEAAKTEANAKLTSAGEDRAGVRRSLEEATARRDAIKLKLDEMRRPGSSQKPGETDKVAGQYKEAEGKCKSLQEESKTADEAYQKAQQEAAAADTEHTQADRKVKDLKELLGAAWQDHKEAQANFATIKGRMKPEDQALLKEYENYGQGALDEKTQQTQKVLRHVDLITQSTTGVSQALGGLGQGLAGLEQADAELHRGEAAKAESKAQEQTQWMQEMRDLVKDVQDKLQGILQSQSDTMKTILRV
jgi:hypothetical protein